VEIGNCTHDRGTCTRHVLAATTAARVVENGYYFPREDINMSLFTLHDGKTYQCTWKGECAYYNTTQLVTPGFPDTSLADAMWSYETAGMGKCSEGWCPSATTCKDIINYGSFDPRVTIDDLGPCIKKGGGGCKGGVCCAPYTCQFDPHEADFVCM